MRAAPVSLSREVNLLNESLEAEKTAAAHPPARAAAVKGGRRWLPILAGPVVALTAIAAYLAVAGSRDEPSPKTDPQVISEQPVSLAEGWLVNSAGSWYLDREHRTYLEITKFDFSAVRRAPIGDRVLTIGPNGDFGIGNISNISSTDAVTVSDPELTGNLQWSPGGDRLAGQIVGKNPDFRIGFAVIEAATGTLTKHWFDHKTHDCSQCGVRWSRDGRELVLAIANRSGGEGAELVSALQLFDAATGTPTRRLPVKAMPSGPFSWSPDGKYVIADADVLKGQLQLIDVATGATTPFAYDAMWATDDVLLASKNYTVLTLRRDGTIAAQATLGGKLTGLRPITVGPPG